MEISYILLIITSFLYGASLIIQSWNDFAPKLINVLIILAILVLVIITGEYGFINQFSEAAWLNYLFPAGAALLGYIILGQNVDDDDWIGVIMALTGLGLIATIITTCCGI